MARYKQLLYLAAKLPPLPPQYHSSENQVQGCVSKVRAHQVFLARRLDPSTCLPGAPRADRKVEVGGGILGGLLLLMLVRDMVIERAKDLTSDPNCWM